MLASSNNPKISIESNFLMANKEYTTIEDQARLKARYQNQSWVVRRWRDRWLLTIPYTAITMWFRTRSRKVVADPDAITNLPFSHCWSLACGLADGDRDYWYTSEEVRTDLFT